MDSTQLQKKSVQLFISFIKDLIDVYPEYKTKLYESYGEIIVEEKFDISEFLDNIKKYERLITNKDNDLFKDDIFILKNISMKELWKEDISDNTKDSIWKYLQTFCVIQINLQSSDSLQELLSGETGEISKENKKDLKDLKRLKKIKANMEKKPLNDQALNMEKMLDGSIIGKIAKEISESISIPTSDGSSEPDISQLLDGNNLMNIFNKVNQTIKQKMESGELNDDIMKKEASDMYPSMMNNDIFKNMESMFNSSINQNNDAPKTSATPTNSTATKISKSSDTSININSNNII